MIVISVATMGLAHFHRADLRQVQFVASLMVLPTPTVIPLA
ncbi:hypothetical protein [Yersinia bercovieri]|nr:hypothetical protein [Yersinia bercovieri]